MNKLIKLFPFMPKRNATGKLIFSILFYLIVPHLVGIVIGFILGLTVILVPFAVIVGLVESAYSIAGIVFAILSFTGYNFSSK